MVQRYPGSFSSSPFPKASAMYFVVVLPSPRSKSPKYPNTTQTMDKIPNLVVPRPRMTKGIVTNPAANGSAIPTKLMIVFFTRAALWSPTTMDSDFGVVMAMIGGSVRRLLPNRCKLPPLAKSVYLDCKEILSFCEDDKPMSLIISEAGRGIERFVIFVARANLSLPSPGPQSSGGMNTGVKILPRPSPIGVRPGGSLPPPVFEAPPPL